jgi:hypothetical protein
MWGYSWHATFPHPPAHITDNIDSLLRRFDPRLYSHLQNSGVSPGLLGWQMLSTMYSEVLSKGTWLKLMDFLLVRFASMEFAVLLAPVAILQALRTALFAADTEAHLVQFFQRQQNIDISALCTNICSMHKTTPVQHFTAVNPVLKSAAQTGDNKPSRRGKKGGKGSAVASKQRAGKQFGLKSAATGDDDDDDMGEDSTEEGK